MLEGFVAPAVTSLIDFEGVREVRFGLEMEVSPSARAYVGYHNLELDTASVALPKIELDDLIQFGVRFYY